MFCVKLPLESSACVEGEQGEGPFVSGSPGCSCMPLALWFDDRNLPQQEPQGFAVYPHQVTMREVGAANSRVW